MNVLEDYYDENYIQSIEIVFNKKIFLKILSMRNRKI